MVDSEPNEEHWQSRRKRELHGGHDFDNGSNETDMQLLVSVHDFVSRIGASYTGKSA
jgi:hypothetical protein